MSKIEDDLKRWNELNRNNHANEMAGAMFYGVLSTIPRRLDEFTGWLTAGVGAAAALLVANIDKVMPFVGQGAYRRAILFLTLSLAAGTFERIVSSYLQGIVECNKALDGEVHRILAKHDIDADQIDELAEKHKIRIETRFELNRAIEKFARPLPWLARKLLARSLKKSGKYKDPALAGFYIPVKVMPWQGVLMLTCLAFAIAGAATIAQSAGNDPVPTRRATDPTSAPKHSDQVTGASDRVK